MADRTPSEVDDGDLFVSSNGEDTWSGKHHEPTEDGTDGPLASIDQALAIARQRFDAAVADGPITIWLRGGRYERSEPLTIGPDDPPVTIAAYPDEEPVIDGGRRIEGWEETEVNGTTAWVTDLPAVRNGEWNFRSLFVDGERRPRPRLPKGDLTALDPEEFYWMQDVPGVDPEADMIQQLFSGSRTFEYAPGDIDPEWRNPTDIDVVALHYWAEERLPVADIDAEAHRLSSTRQSIFALIDDVEERYARYYLENVFEALSEPGEWYLDQQEGRLYYLPRPGETIEATTVTAPQVNQFLRLQGDPEDRETVDHVRLDGLTFRHTDWEQPTDSTGWDWTDPEIDYAAEPQGAANVPGAIALEGARNCAIEACTIEHVGWYGIELGDGCRYNRIVGNDIRDLGAGGVTASGADIDGSRARRTGHNRITDNTICSGGRVFHSAVGVLARFVFDTAITHNHVRDFHYTGISVGWEWTYDEQVTRDNRIEYNHIHDIGQGILSDIGGIYTLGVQPGTVIRHNHVHDIRDQNYGGWAIYLDEATSHITVEQNLCHDTSEFLFHLHFGRENVVRNNVFAFGSEGLVGLTRGHPLDGIEWKRSLDARVDHDGWHDQGDTVPAVLLSGGMDSNLANVYHNVLIAADAPVFVGNDADDIALEDCALDSNCNVFWDLEHSEPFSANTAADGVEDAEYSRVFDFEEWQALGYDRQSVVAEPGFADITDRDFSIPEESLDLEIPFEPIDVEAVGPRPGRQ